MAYTVNKTNTSASVASYIVQDNVLNTETDIKFVGKGYSGYGETIAENFLALLENFSNTLVFMNSKKSTYVFLNLFETLIFCS